jgi:ATP-binding cassette subfamily F protein 3
MAPAHVDTPFDFSFRRAPAHPDPASVLDEVQAGYGGHIVLSGIRFTLRAGSRVGLLGRNGAGKSTFVKLLAGELPPAGGSRVEGKGLAIGYFAQRQLDQLRPEDNPLQHLSRLDPRVREQDLRDFLGGFDFRGDGALAPVARFSGGEKSRLGLALIAWQRPNVLLLDEPTNHLDLEMRLALLRALQDFEGAMVLVSHDRSLLRAACDQLYLVDGGRVTEFDGDLDDYTRSLQTPVLVENQTVQPGVNRREQRRMEAQERERRSARLRPLQAQIRAAEQDMAQLAADKALLEKRLAAPDIYADARKDDLRQCLLQRAQLDQRLAEAEERWLQLSARLEAIEGAG